VNVQHHISKKKKKKKKKRRERMPDGCWKMMEIRE
jgi:hypothetical protein